jgi:hypothetical protein
MMPFWSDIKSLTVSRAPTNVIKEKACSLGMGTLLQDGWGRVVDGITTFEEVLKVARGAEFVSEPEQQVEDPTYAKDEAHQKGAEVEA